MAEELNGFDFIFTRSVSDTCRPASGDLQKLIECDNVFTYEECGWFCVAGSKNDRRTVHLHLNNRGEWDQMIGLAGYSLSGGGLNGGVLVKDPEAYQRVVGKYVDSKYRRSWRDRPSARQP